MKTSSKADKPLSKMKTSSKGDEPSKTTKKQKLVWHKMLVDAETGEEIAAEVKTIEDRDFNFHKVWLKNLISSLEEISNKQIRLAFWILEHLDSENQLIMTQRVIAQKSGVSLNTVIRTMKALQEGSPPFLQKINSGAYRVNPNVIWKGPYSKRMRVHKKSQETAQKRAEATKEGQETGGLPETMLPGQTALEAAAEAIETVT